MKSLLDPEFKYTPSVETDLRKTFARVRREQRAAAQKVIPLQQPTEGATHGSKAIALPRGEGRKR